MIPGNVQRKTDRRERQNIQEGTRMQSVIGDRNDQYLQINVIEQPVSAANCSYFVDSA